MIASLVYPRLAKCVGIELLDSLATLGKSVNEKLIGEASYRGVPCAPIIVKQGDIFEADWSDADIIFVASVCFSNEMLEGVADKCASLKKGTRILFMNYLPERPYIREVASWKGQFTWGLHLIRYYTIV